MSQTLQIPLFPLGTVLFPGGRLPLQIFEVRYLDMIKRCHRDGSPFGVVCLTQGSEVQQPAGDGFKREAFHPAGTLARLVRVEQPQTGLLLIVCEGAERFRIDRSEKQAHGLWTAEVMTLPPDQSLPLPEELRGMAKALHRLHERLQVEHPGMAAPTPAFSDHDSPWQDAGWVANRWAELLPVSLDTKQRLLMLDSPLLRLELLDDLLTQMGIAH